MNYVAFLLELRDSIEENFLRAPDFFLERIDDDRRLIDLACRMICDSFCVSSCLHAHEEPSFEEQLNTVEQEKRDMRLMAVDLLLSSLLVVVSSLDDRKSSLDIPVNQPCVGHCNWRI